MTSYEQSVALLQNALKFGIDASLEAEVDLCAALGSPQTTYDTIQVAGTNGKSSTARYTAALLREQGLRVGLYLSPHLVYYEERLEIDGQVISREAFAQAVGEATNKIDGMLAQGHFQGPLTEFEILTAAAFLAFRQAQVDVAVLEVGLGGRWDATSVVHPKVAAITGIGLDHMRILGDTVEKIAAEKAAIIKPATRVVLGTGTAQTHQVFEEQITASGAELYKDLAQGIPECGGLNNDGNAAHVPAYQHQNIACAQATAEAYLGHPLDPQAVARICTDLPIPGRFEVLARDPLLLIDAAHNPQSATELARALTERFETHELTLLLAILADKDAAGIIEVIAPLFGSVVVTQTPSARALPATELAQRVEELCGRQPRVYPTVEQALRALRGAGEPTVATGSITLAGEVKRIALETSLLSARM
jgi:dihydrofolate synthase/folylpolyglutamate synthase